MDTSVAANKTDRLGRRTGPRRKYSVAEKLQIVEETRAIGASVADVGRAHGINANIVFGWRRLAQRGLLRAPGAESAPLLPVKVESPTLLPTVKTPASATNTVVPMQEGGSTAKRARSERTGGVIEIELSNGHRVRVQGAVDANALKLVIGVLVRR